MISEVNFLSDILFISISYLDKRFLTSGKMLDIYYQLTMSLKFVKYTLSNSCYENRHVFSQKRQKLISAIVLCIQKH